MATMKTLDMTSESGIESKSGPQETQTAILSVNKTLPGDLGNDRDKIEETSRSANSGNTLKRSAINNKKQDNTAASELRRDTKPTAVSRFLSFHLQGSIEVGCFGSVNDVYMKYSVVTGPDWILGAGSEVGITQISRYKKDESGSRIFVWNQPISVSYRSYNYFGWPQIVLSVYYFDAFGNDQILGYGCTHLPISNSTWGNSKLVVKIHAPQSSSMIRQVVSWFVGRKPELVDSNLLARADCRSLLQMVHVGVENHHQHHTVTWLENLKRGLSYFMLHPFFPFHQASRFNFLCLFGRRNYCCSIDGCDNRINDASHSNSTNDTLTQQGYASLLKHHANLIVGRMNDTGLVNLTVQNLDTKPNTSVTHIHYIKNLAKLASSRLSQIQLILCTIALTYYLAHDIRFVIKYLRARRNNKVP